MRGRRKKGLETALTGLEMEAALKDIPFIPLEDIPLVDIDMEAVFWSKEEMEAVSKELDIYLEKALGELEV